MRRYGDSNTVVIPGDSSAVGFTMTPLTPPSSAECRKVSECVPDLRGLYWIGDNGKQSVAAVGLLRVDVYECGNGTSLSVALSGGTSGHNITVTHIDTGYLILSAITTAPGIDTRAWAGTFNISAFNPDYAVDTNNTIYFVPGNYIVECVGWTSQTVYLSGSHVSIVLYQEGGG